MTISAIYEIHKEIKFCWIISQKHIKYKPTFKLLNLSVIPLRTCPNEDETFNCFLYTFLQILNAVLNTKKSCLHCFWGWWQFTEFDWHLCKICSTSGRSNLDYRPCAWQPVDRSGHGPDQGTLWSTKISLGVDILASFEPFIETKVCLPVSSLFL